MKKTMKSLIGLALLLTSPALFAITGLEIAQTHDDRDKPDTTHMALQMDLIEANGKVSSRLIEQWGVEDNDLANSIMVFRKPASVKDTRFLQVENEDRDDDKWIYLPAMKKVRRIASSDGSKSFMGSDASYDDMETRDIDRDTHELIREESFSTWDCYVVKGQAVDPSDSQYAYRLTWFDKETFYPVKVEMYDKKESLYKVMTVKDLKNIDTHWTPIDTLIENVQNGHSTEMKVLNVEFDKPVNKRMFTTQFLNTGR
ncbi:MAG: outer membrane lipoprotein-sorting protein [Spirochaetaceae bacterium 4572_59]|nr:MAG: outer membrane lipoprotein-sorting protein [Spirochaetaceae bacterium 4572_59]